MLIRLAETVADQFHIRNEPCEFFVQFGAALHDIAHVAGLAFLLPEYVDDADDIEERGGTDEQNSLLVGVGPEFAVALQGHQKCRFDGHEHHDEIRNFDSGKIVVAGLGETW